MGPRLDPYARPLRLNANIIGGGLLLVEIVSYFTAFSLSEILMALFPANFIMDHYSLILQVLGLAVHAIGFAVPCVFMVTLTGIPHAAAFPMRRVKPSFALPAVFFSMGACYVGVSLSSFLSLLLQNTLGLTPGMSDFTPPVGGMATVFYFLSVVLSPAIFEELVFRGVIMQSLRRFGDGFALSVSAVLFALCHGNLVQGPNALVMGFVIGYFVLRTGSLSIGMLIHFVNNGVSAVITVVSASWETAGLVLYGMTILTYILGGLIAGVYLLLAYPRMFRTIPSGYPLSEGKKQRTFYTAFPVIGYVGYSLYKMWTSLL